MTTETKFSEQIKEKIKQAELTKAERSLENAFLEILNNPDLYKLAKDTEMTNTIFYTIDDPLFPLTQFPLIERRYNEWRFGILNNFDIKAPCAQYQIKGFDKSIKKELAFIIGNGIFDGLFQILSKSIIKKGGPIIRDVLRELKDKNILSAGNYYDEGNNSIAYRDMNDDVSNLGKGLTPKKLKEIILEEAVKPFSLYRK